MSTKSTYHITQFRHRRFNPGGDYESANCGPTSLAMVCALEGGSLSGSPQQRIDRARWWMFAGVDAQRQGLHHRRGRWLRDAAAASTLTDLVDVRRGALRLGLQLRPILNHQQMLEQLRQTRPVILAGYPGDAPGYQELSGVDFPGGHFLVASRWCQSTDRVEVYDPLCARGPLWVDSEWLEHFSRRSIFVEGRGLAAFKWTARMPGRGLGEFAFRALPTTGEYPAHPVGSA